ncbi:sugar nucleotide-binding protein [Corynebacterium sp.]|uniref:sugar nucleotide-binding protein n=1 Tax=Corynebacterium sp. TaxID=1720 RepID=UPI0025C1BF89|nr:sugar nucleotide-binding protein [Corynebacterium sp.]
MPRRVLLAGCGQVGGELAGRLAARGAEVFALRRDTTALPSCVTPLPVDLLSDRLSTEVEPLPAVDAMVVTLTPGIGGPGNPDGYLAALGNLATALPGVPARTVFVSSTGVFDRPTQDGTLTEADTPVPASPRAQTLLAGERAAEALFGALVVRPAGIYGPGREFMLRTATSGTPVQYARRTNRIHQTDLVRALEVMLDAVDPPAVLHAVDQRPATLGEVVTFLADELGVKPPPPVTPEEPTGSFFDGAALGRLVGALRYPGFVQGYRGMLAQRR